MSMEELAGLFADDSEKPYAKYDKPEPEEKVFATGGFLDIASGKYTIGFGAGSFLTGVGIGTGKSYFAQAALEAMKTTQVKLRGIGAHIDVVFMDEVADFEARADMSKGMRALMDSLYVDPSPRLSSKSWGFKRKIINTSEKDAYKAKTRGQRFPGTGWGRTK